MTRENCHIGEMREAAEPQPPKDYVRRNALQHGYNVAIAEGPALMSFASWKAGVEAMELYVACHRAQSERVSRLS